MRCLAGNYSIPLGKLLLSQTTFLLRLNVWILNKENQLITRQPDEDILNGITRQSIQRIAAERQMEIVERPFSVAEMMQAKEVFVTSATSMVTALTHIDGKKIDKGKVGLIASALKADYIRYVETCS